MKAFILGKFITFLIFFIVAICFFTPRTVVYANSNAAVVWNQLITQLGTTDALPPTTFSRIYALNHVGMYDALLKNNSQHQQALLAGVASEILCYLFPNHVDQIKQLEESQISEDDHPAHHKNQAAKNKAKHGHKLGKEIISYAQSDRYSTPFTGAIPQGPCKWKGTNPVTPMAGSWKTYILSSGSEFNPPAPYDCGSPLQLADVQKIKDTAKNLTDDQRNIALLYKVSPSITWNKYLTDRVTAQNMNLSDSIRAYAYLNIAIYDAFVTTWHVKYTYWTERPITMISNFTPMFTTPNFPAYPSGHATISSAASVVMGELFSSEKNTFSDLAKLHALSRLYGGIHCEQDNNEGLILGKPIGEKVVNDMHKKSHTFIVSTRGNNGDQQGDFHGDE